jgi:hypothetical protein
MGFWKESLPRPINSLFIPFLLFIDQLDSVLQSKHFLGFFILDVTSEFLFEVHRQLDKIGLRCIKELVE